MTDAQLLERFINGRDETAFQTLIQRHATMVWGVCRRVLGRHHDAEDAFQATFLVLATKAATVSPREMLPNWLYGVAYQTAQRARSAAAKRQRREKTVAVTPEREWLAPPPPDERLGWLDRELKHLPEKYRVPIILCELEAVTHQEAAQRLGCPVGTLSARLSRGRTLLAKRLRRHRLGFSVAALCALITEDAVAAPPPYALAASTAKAATAFAHGRAAASAVASVQALDLAQGVIATMRLAKLKGIAAGVAGLFALGTVAVCLAVAGTSRPEVARRDVPAQQSQVTTAPAAGVNDAPTSNAAVAGKPVPRPVDRQIAAKAVDDDEPAKPPTAPAEPLPPAEAGQIWNVALSSDGKRLVAGVEKVADRPAEFIVWELASRRELLRVPEPRTSRSVTFSPDGLIIATAGFGPVARLFDAATGRMFRPLRGHTRGMNAVVFSPDGATVATGSWDHTIKLWTSATGVARETLTGHTAAVYGLAYAPDGTTLASCGVDGTARIWDAASGKERFVLNGHEGTIECLAYSPDGKTLVTAGWDHTLRLWDVATGRPLATLEGPSDQLGVTFSPDGKILASLSAPHGGPPGRLSAVLMLWDVAGRKPVATIPAHADRSYSVLFTPDGKTLVTASMDRTIKIWDVATHKNIATLTSAPRDAGAANVPSTPEPLKPAGRGPQAQP